MSRTSRTFDEVDALQRPLLLAEVNPVTTQALVTWSQRLGQTRGTRRLHPEDGEDARRYRKQKKVG